MKKKKKKEREVQRKRNGEHGGCAHFTSEGTKYKTASCKKREECLGGEGGRGGGKKMGKTSIRDSRGGATMYLKGPKGEIVKKPRGQVNLESGAKQGEGKPKKNG